MKKLFTLFALFAICLGANAKTVEDVFCDYSTWTEWNLYKMGYKPQIRDGVLWSNPAVHAWQDAKPEEGIEEGYTGETAGWYQFFMMPAFEAQVGTNYEVTFKVKGSDAGSFNVNARWSWSEDPRNATVEFTNDWTEQTVIFPEVGGASIDLILQSSFQGDIEVAWIKVSHDEKESRPTEWIQLLENGDAEKAWSEVVPGDPVAFNDNENNYKICAYGKEYAGRDASNGNAEICDPHPAEIVEDADGNHVFVVRTKHVVPEEYPDFFLNDDGSVKGDPQWQNQFWIQSPKSWKGGEQVRISFKYKASQTTGAVNTQCHAQSPGSYLHWAAIGDINFTEEWQEFNKVITIPDAGNGMWSVAFNLGSSDNWKEDIDFYFDNLSWEEMKLDHGYFLAGCNTNTGLEYDFDNAIAFEEDGDLLVATIGEKGKPDTYVDQIMVSTVRGNDQAFKAATLSVPAVNNDPDDFQIISEKSMAKLTLPGEGVWKVYIDLGYNMMAFEMIEGKEKKPIEVVPNPTEIKIAALERDFTDAEQEGGTGQAWDNQMWICANRTLAKGEVTYLEFKYKAAAEAKSSTQCHGAPGAYMHWAAIGDVNFGTDWQTAEITFTVPNEADGMQTIAFNLAEIKEANDYYIKDVIWVVGSKELSYESLIATEGDQHIAWKVVGGDIVVGDPAGLETINADSKSSIMFNLNGQRVNNAKGLVIKNGKVQFVK